MIYKYCNSEKDVAIFRVEDVLEHGPSPISKLTFDTLLSAWGAETHDYKMCGGGGLFKYSMENSRRQSS